MLFTSALVRENGVNGPSSLNVLKLANRPEIEPVKTLIHQNVSQVIAMDQKWKLDNVHMNLSGVPGLIGLLVHRHVKLVNKLELELALT